MITFAEAVPQITATGAPVLCIDTCALLDLVRAPARKLGAGHVEAANFLLKKAEEQQSQLSIVLMKQVCDELPQYLERAKDEANQALKRLDEETKRSVELLAALGVAPPNAFEFVPFEFANKAEDLITGISNAAAKIDDQPFVGAAGQRVRDRRRPARQGRDSFGDCIILEAFLSLVTKLRTCGFQREIVFLTSNTSDFADENKKVVHPEIRADLGDAELSFSFLEARYHLFPTGQTQEG